MILIVFVLLVLFLFGFIIFWIFKNPQRAKVAFVILGGFLTLLLIFNLFFVDHSMQFIQSEVYPRLYLLKNEINDQDSVNRLIKEMVVRKMNSEFVGNEEVHKYKYQYDEDSPVRRDLHYSLRFYTYFEGGGVNPFGQAGTAHFIKNKEDPGGFSSEELDHYRDYLRASYDVSFCDNDTVNYIGILRYYRNGDEIQKDTIINKCGPTPVVQLSK